jgi:hypothetical protein
MDERLQALLADIRRADQLAGQELTRAQRRAAWLGEADAAATREFLTAAADLIAAADPAQPPSPQGDRLLATAIAGLARQRPAGHSFPVEEAGRLYRALAGGSEARPCLLAWLASAGSGPEIEKLVRLLVSDPPTGDSAVVRALAPLFQRRDVPVDALFPALLGALAHPQLAAPVLDLANFLAREGRAGPHPAASRSPQLIALLGEIVQSLARLVEDPASAAAPAAQISQRVAGQVALAVSLCDALGLIGDRDAIGKLNQALALSHRRLRTEAAAALARLGDADGASELVKLAEEPVARLRVLAYARELGLQGKIEPHLQSPQARAEAELAVWLAEPTQFGVPPLSMELFDQRRQFWPGFSEPVDCFLFRFTYAVTVEGDGERSFSNIGIAGPLAHAFLADLADLPPDDIYAAFAGWQAEHAEIREYDVARLSKSEKLEAERLIRRLHDAGYDEIEPQTMGYFFGDKALVVTAQREAMTGIAVADFQEIAFFPQRHSRRPLGPAECYDLYKGRKLLRSFNRAPAEP